MRVESVRMYVIKPVIPPAALPRSIHSYNCWAIIIVFFALKLIDLAASCCNDDVINGFAGFLFLSLRFTLSILNSLFFIFFNILSLSFFFLFFFFFHSLLLKLFIKILFYLFIFLSIDQYLFLYN